MLALKHLIQKVLCWLPETRFADGIGRTIDWYLANRPWWEEILSGAYRTGYERLCGGSPTP